MSIALPSNLRSRLITSDAWMTVERRYDSTGSDPHRFLIALWGLLDEFLSAEDQQRLALAVLDAKQPHIHIIRQDNDNYFIVLSVALLEAALAYSQAWVQYHHPELAAGDLETLSAKQAAQDLALQMAQTYRRRGNIVARSANLTADGHTLATAHTCVGLTFLLLHECAHLRAGHLLPESSPDACLQLDNAHRIELEADRHAAEWMAANPPAQTNAGESLRILFELLHLLAVGVPDSLASHPLPLKRFMDLAPVISNSELSAAIESLQLGRNGFWYLSTADEQP